MRPEPASPSMFPEMSPTWTAIVLRAPDATWDGQAYQGASLEAVDLPTLSPGVVPVRVVREGALVAVASPCAQSANAAAERLRIAWRTSVTLRQGTRPAAPDSDVYSWASTEAHSSPGLRAWARWTDTGILEVVAEDVDPNRLRRMLGRELQLDPARIRVAFPTRIAPNRGRGTSAPHTLSAALEASVDAALVSRLIGKPVVVHAEPAALADDLAIAVRAESAGTNLNGWTFTPSLPIGRRPPWSAMAAGRTTRSNAALGGNVVMPYDLKLTVTSASDPLTPEGAVVDAIAEQASVFALECFADDNAAAVGQDPVRWRLDRLRDAQGRAMIEEVARRAGWIERDTAAASHESALRAGRGFACAVIEDADADDQEARNAGARAWSAWVVDLEVDLSAGRIVLTGLTVGHHVEGMHAAPELDAELRANITNATAALLGPARAFDDWTQDAPVSWPTVELATVATSSALPMPSRLSHSDALTLPLAAAISNAILDATGLRLRSAPFDAFALRRGERAAADPSYSAVLPGTGARWRGSWRRAAAWAGSLAAAAAGVAAIALPWRAAIAPVAPDVTLYSAGAIERGRLIAAASDCVVCHTTEGGRENAGGLAMDTPFGTIYSTNITSDPVHGIGAWSYQAFDRAMRQGVSRDGRHLYPAFPYTSFAKFSDADMQALYAYLMTQQPVATSPPTTQLAFPYNIRPLMAGWNLLFHDAKPFQADPERSMLWNRGAYLVNGAGHCGACHTPRNAMGAERKGSNNFLAGATIDAWDAPALNSLRGGALPWTSSELYTYLRTGHSARHGVAAGPMAPVIAGLAELPDQDILAMTTYLMDVPGAGQTGAGQTATSKSLAEPAPAPVSSAAPAPAWQPRLSDAAGERIFEGACAACHDTGRGLPLFGVRPDLSTNTNLVSERPDNLIHVILNGITDPANDELGFMPGFGGSLSDGQITDLVHYLRERYGAGQPAWTDVSDTVARLRELEHGTSAQEITR